MNPETSTARLSSRSRDITRPSGKPGYVLPRLLWMAIGPGLIMILSVLKLELRSNQTGSIDVAFLAVACGILLIRWGTWFAGDECDSFGRKTSVQNLLGFTGLVLVSACGIWALTNLVVTLQVAS